ncbi:MAG: sulfotransferase [Pseudomonadota bacterium]
MSIQEAYDLHKSGQLAAAEAAYTKVLDDQPDRPDALHLLGVLKAQSGKPADAIALIGRAIELAPEEPNFHFNLGHALRTQGRAEEAEKAYRQALVLAPDHGGAPAALGELLLAGGRAEEALVLLKRAAELAPRSPGIRLALGTAHESKGDDEAATAAFHEALGLDPSLAEAHYRLAEGLRRRGQVADAMSGYRRTLELSPNHGRGHLRLGWCLSVLGHFDEAEHHLRQAATLEPAILARAFSQISLFKRYEAGDPDLAAMAQALDRPGLEAADGVRLGFALAKAHDDLGDHDRAFAHWSAANGAKRQSLRYQIEDTRAACQLMKETFTAEALAPRAHCGAESELPIFIVGMPRSGTSLVEQILASHPAVHGGGELNTLQEIGERFLSSFGDGPPSPEEIHGTSDEAWRALGDAYVGQLATLAPEAQRITDKEPGNVMRLALVRKILPRARIVHVLRDPMDTCFSCYRKLFRRGSAFSYDLADLGAHYQIYREMMDHWQAAMGDQILTLHYEELVASPEPTIPGLLAFCGLTWDPACLAFHDHERPVDTFSLAQVRQPLYRQSVGNWRPYEAYLGPLRDSLGPYGPS